MPASFDAVAAQRFVDDRWDEILPVLCDYVRIPNRSPHYDVEWATAGHMDRAVELLRSWAAAEAPAGSTVEVVRLEGRTPVILVEVPATPGAAADDTVLLYGHLDKQPEMVGWRPGLGPWEPVVDGDRLYGRGAADDGYSLFAATTALAALREGGGEHARCVVLIEASEESGSPDLPAYVDHLSDRLGTIGFVVCLDAGCATYDRLWVTTSLRGLVSATVRVDVLEEGIHSGASGVVPSSFRILRSLISRLEDEATGRMLLDSLTVDVPPARVAEAAHAAQVAGAPTCSGLLPGVRPMVDDAAEAVLARTWRAALSVTGVDGIPPLTAAGNVLRPFTALQLSIRTPPTCDVARVEEEVRAALTDDPPYGAHVSVSFAGRGSGWDAPATAPWLADALDRASSACWGRPSAATGEGGTIPFMAMLGERFPAAQFAVLGVLGPGSNAHGPNEFLDLPTARRLTTAVAVLLEAHAARR